MDSGQMEMLIGKVQHQMNQAWREIADMMREFWEECESGKDVVVPEIGKASPTDFDPPFDERGRHVEQAPSVPPVPPVLSDAVWAGNSGALLPDAIAKAKLRARYKFLVNVLSGPGTDKENTLQRIRDCKKEAEAKGIELEVLPADPTVSVKQESAMREIVERANTAASAASPSPDPARVSVAPASLLPSKTENATAPETRVKSVAPGKMVPRSSTPGKKVKKANLKVGKTGKVKAKGRR
jgi:hypothetical protein